MAFPALTQPWTAGAHLWLTATPGLSLNPKLWGLQQDHFCFSGHQQQWEKSFPLILLLRDLQGFSLVKNN